LKEKPVAHIEIHLDWDELPPDGTVFAVGRIVAPDPDEGDPRSFDQRAGIDFCATCGREYRGRVLDEVPNPPCEDCRHWDPKPLADAEPDSARAIAMAEGMGGDAGEVAAALWVRETTHRYIGSERQMFAHLQRVLQSMEDHDDLQDDLPRADLSGEWADTLTGPALVDTCTDGNETLAQDMFTEICDAYEQAFHLSVRAHIRAMIAEKFASWNPEWLLPENYGITQTDIDVLFNLIPGAHDALQGMSIENTKGLWDNTCVNMEGMLDHFTRDDLRKRVATAIRVTVYGEFVDEAYPSEEAATV
jgi:hypothetical protein